ncbi:hypothetical protein CDG81_19500 [Actinopolyspora erythraea]|nr:hypothetical protein CDG81_19500 [Actinopolyspora erythraea]
MAYHRGRVYLGCSDGRLYRVDPGNGESELVTGPKGDTVQDNREPSGDPGQRPRYPIADLASCNTEAKPPRDCDGKTTTTTGGKPTATTGGRTEPPIKGMNNILEALLGTVTQALMSIGGCRLGSILARILDALANILSNIGNGKCKCERCHDDGKDDGCRSCAGCDGERREAGTGRSEGDSEGSGP